MHNKQKHRKKNSNISSFWTRHLPIETVEREQLPPEKKGRNFFESESENPIETPPFCLFIQYQIHNFTFPLLSEKQERARRRKERKN